MAGKRKQRKRSKTSSSSAGAATAGNSGKNSHRAAHLKLYQFKAGQSGNPDGRPRGNREFAELIADETRDGAELIEYALAVLRGEKGHEELGDVRWAVEYLTTRMLGRAPQTIELTGRGGGPIEFGHREQLIARFAALLAVRVEGPAPRPAVLPAAPGAPIAS